jgi:tetratricopeptide (TPR) repeat protein
MTKKMRSLRTVILMAVCFLLPGVVWACLWDYDTLMMERVRFPTTLELITGKFLRHSKEFYEWRIQDRQKKLAQDPNNLAYYDDLAVAYDKLGQHEKAIETILAKDQIKPGLYETEANLSTFYIHAGQLEKGLEHVERAIQINPNAHFGREKYQRLLVQYIISRRHDGKTVLPLATPPAGDEGAAVQPTNGDFASFLNSGNSYGLSEADRRAALSGILGMMKFAKFDSPILLEPLGDLLARGWDGEPARDAKLLAARAYLKASYAVDDESAKAAYRRLAEDVLELQVKNVLHAEMSLQELEQTFQKELAEAEQWYDELRQNELSWIEQGKDADLEFTKMYYDEPQVSSSERGLKDRLLDNPRRMAIAAAAGAMLVTLAFIVLGVIRRQRAKALHRTDGKN